MAAIEFLLRRHDEAAEAAEAAAHGASGASGAAAAAAHHHHHGANLPYGYFVFFCIDVLYPLYLGIIATAYQRKWTKTGRSTSWLRLVSVPLPTKILLWSCVLLLVGFWKFTSGTGFVGHIKRFGRISYVLIPLDILLSFRPSPIPFNHYLDLIVLHKWVSRLIIICATFHSVGYGVIWIQQNAFEKALRILNLIGVIDFILFFILLIISIKKLRHYSYDWFYAFHMITVWATVIGIVFHARPGVTPYGCLCVVMMLYQTFSRIKNSVALDRLHVMRPEGATLSLITIPKTNSLNVFSPASHVRISLPILNPKSWIFPTHPYTIASLPQDNDIKLVIKESKFRFDPTRDYSMLGPYEALHMNFFQTAENVCIICGGSGIAYGIPIYNHFKRATSDFIDVKLVWVTRNRKDLYLLKELKLKGIDIYITATVEEPIEPSNNAAIPQDVDGAEAGDPDEFEQFLINDSDSNLDLRDSMDSFDLDANPFNESKTMIENSTNVIEKNLIHYGSRPVLETCFKKQLLKTADNANKWVVACGSDSLLKDAKAFAKRNGTRFVAEVYAM